MTLQERINAIQNSEELSDEQKAEELAKLNAEFEKAEQMIKDNQSAFTKANQQQIEIAKMLVEQNPANVEKIPDEKVRKKVLQDKWGVDSIEQLKIMFPDYDKTNDGSEEDEQDEFKKLQQKVKLMEYNNTKTKINEEIDWVMTSNQELISTIPDFRDKLEKELSNISEKLSPKERVERATRLVVGSDVSTSNLYAMMQWVSAPSSQGNGEWEEQAIEESPLARAFKSNIK